MEIEAKFTVPNRRTYRAVGAPALADRLFARPGWQIPTPTINTSIRPRSAVGGGIPPAGCAPWTAACCLTLKGLGGAKAAIHLRAEHETVAGLGFPIRPLARGRGASHRFGGWPAARRSSHSSRCSNGASSPTSWTATGGSGSSASMTSGPRQGGRPASYYELELELAETGAEADLTAIAASFHLDLGPGARAALEVRAALEMLRQRDEVAQHLSPTERAALPSRVAEGWHAGGARASRDPGLGPGLPPCDRGAHRVSSGRVRFGCARSGRSGWPYAGTFGEEAGWTARSSVTLKPLPRTNLWHRLPWPVSQDGQSLIPAFVLPGEDARGNLLADRRAARPSSGG